MRQTHLSHQFVEYIPEQIEEGVLYISKRYGTAVHKCCCGCGEEVITPLGPTDWSLWVTGNDVTLDPSIGNWSYACRSHYLIRRSKVVWAGQMSKQKIERGRAIDRVAKQAYFESANRKKELPSQMPQIKSSPQIREFRTLSDLWLDLKRWWNS